MTLRSCWSLPILFLHTFSIHNPVIKQCTRLIIFFFLSFFKCFEVCSSVVLWEIMPVSTLFQYAYDMTISFIGWDDRNTRENLPQVIDIIISFHIYLFLCPFISCKSNRPQFYYFWGIRQVTLKISILKIACWLLINVKWAIFQPYHGENKIHFHERSMMSALYQANRLSLICIVLQQSAGRHLSTGTHLDSEPRPV